MLHGSLRQGSRTLAALGVWGENRRVPPLHTPVCRTLGIDCPIFSVGFADGAGPELVAAVSNAGGCGVLGGCPPEVMRGWISAVRKLTTRPFGANAIIATLEAADADEEDREEARQRVSAAIEERVPILVLFWGDPSPFVSGAHADGVKGFVQPGSVEAAKRAADAGVDAVIAQGVEAGGHVQAPGSLGEGLSRVGGG